MCGRITTVMPKLLAPVLLFMLLVACGSSSACPVQHSKVVIDTADGSATLNVEVASSQEDQERGLSGRSSLGPDAGMAFAFGRPVHDAFWMKDTTIPLSVAFWDPSGRIIAMFDMAPCGAGPCRRYRPNEPYVGAVEANRGYFSSHGIAMGDRIRLMAPALGCD
jgi:uncharacterized membrane protein (UPF0127 family)